MWHEVQSITTGGLGGVVRWFHARAARTSKELVARVDVARGTKYYNWGFGGRCKPPNGVRGEAPEAFAYYATFIPKIAIS